MKRINFYLSMLLLMAVAVGIVVLSALGCCPAFLYTATDGLCRLLLWILEIIAAM